MLGLGPVSLMAAGIKPVTIIAFGAGMVTGIVRERLYDSLEKGRDFPDTAKHIGKGFFTEPAWLARKVANRIADHREIRNKRVNGKNKEKNLTQKQIEKIVESQLSQKKRGKRTVELVH